MYCQPGEGRGAATNLGASEMAAAGVRGLQAVARPTDAEMMMIYLPWRGGKLGAPNTTILNASIWVTGHDDPKRSGGGTTRPQDGTAG